MPFYDLRCTACEKEYKISATMKEKSDKLIPCPDCGSLELETVFNVPPAYVKGREKCPQAQSCGGCRV